MRHDHPLIHCSIARGLWSFVMRILGFNGSLKVVVYFIWRNLFGRQLVIDLYGHFGGGGIVAHFVNFGVRWIIHEKVCVIHLKRSFWKAASLYLIWTILRRREREGVV